MSFFWLTFRIDFSVDHSVAAFGEAIQQKALNKAVSEDQANFKFGSLDQAT